MKNFSIIDTTLREGEQCIDVNFFSQDRKEIAQALDDIGIEFIEMVSPKVSPQSQKDLKMIANMGLNAKILTHVRCQKDDINLALDCGVQGINLFIGASEFLQKYSIHKTVDQIIDLTSDVLSYAKGQSPDIILRFSTEDSFRSNHKDLIRIYSAIEQLGVVDRFGLADTVGIATPNEVTDLVSLLREITDKDIEFHAHNDTGCSIANSYNAIMAGATHIDTSVFGLGERNGITSLAGLIARIYSIDREYVKKKYNLLKLHQVHKLVQEKMKIHVSFNHFIFGSVAFSHKAGLHTNAIIQNPETYEILKPEDFGLHRTISVANKMVGIHVIEQRTKELGLKMNHDNLVELVKKIKNISDVEILNDDKLNQIIRDFSQSLSISKN
ncbi:MAG: homocitrate synthase [Spirochaetes bacterium]|nr:homocitrate synthase [Spirochaetota bacterium]